MDLVLSISGLAFLAPLLIIIAICIKCESRGPVFFCQDREGLHGRIFRIFKFRSMWVTYEDRSGIAQTVAGDGRITRMGRFIRRTSIDELPQLINVVLGHMSLVGPRPHVPGMLAAGIRYDQLVPTYSLRHQVRPGITGWAQACGLRGPTKDRARAIARIQHDLEYVQNFSLLLDFKILVMTLRHEFLSGRAD
ncbi:sugar transferase [Devosia sp. PTR5]|uniref:Sugar transferase n=1 Tax=Devosia oryzisoli TaxID=2774138 RepID=A0A927ITQ4_9HYPH|nr:sugar transferase [Devosia oryzisoli]